VDRYSESVRRSILGWSGILVGSFDFSELRLLHLKNPRERQPGILEIEHKNIEKKRKELKPTIVKRAYKNCTQFNAV